MRNRDQSVTSLYVPKRLWRSQLRSKSPAERAWDLYPHEAHSSQAVIEIITRYVVARASRKARTSSFFPPVTAAAAHALARRAVRPVSHTPPQSCQAPKWCAAARGAQRLHTAIHKTNFEFSNAACNKCAPCAGYKSPKTRGETDSRKQPARRHPFGQVEKY